MKFPIYAFNCICAKFVILPNEIWFKTNKYEVWITDKNSYISNNKILSMININSRIVFDINKNLDSQIEIYLLLS